MVNMHGGRLSILSYIIIIMQLINLNFPLNRWNMQAPFGVYIEAAYALALCDGKDLAWVLTREWALVWGHYGTP